MKNFSCIPVTEKILGDLKATKEDALAVKPYASTENGEGAFFIISEVSVHRIDEKKDRDIITGTILLSKFDGNLQLTDQNSFPDLYEEIHSVYCRHEGSLFSLPSGELIFSTSLNRTYVFDGDGRKILKKYNTKLKSFLSKEEKNSNLNADDPMELLANNFITRGTICHDTGRLLALVDSLAAEQVSERRMRGEILAISEEPFTDYSLRPELQLLHVLNDQFEGSLKKDQSIPYVKTVDKVSLTFESWPQKSMAAKLKEEGHNLLTGVLWTEQPLAMGKGKFFLPVYMKMLRMGAKGYPFFGFIMDEEGSITAELKDFDLREDSPYTREQFRFAISGKEERIYYKNDYGVYLFDYEGNLLEKCYFSDPDVKALRPYRLFSSTSDGKILLFHDKNLDFLILSPVSESIGLKEMIKESIQLFKKDKSKAKKNYSYENKCWFGS